MTEAMHDIRRLMNDFEKSNSRWYFVSRRISPDLIGDLSRHRADMA